MLEPNRSPDTGVNCIGDLMLGSVHGTSTFLLGRDRKEGWCLFRWEALLRWIEGIRSHRAIERPDVGKTVDLLVVHELMPSSVSVTGDTVQ